MFAYDYPLLGVFWTMVWWFLFIAWIMLLFRIVADIFRSRDMGGFAKAIWLLFVIALPYLGAFVYVIARGRGMGERDAEMMAANERATQAYIRDAAGSASAADEISKLADLRDRGVITDDEFSRKKASLLA